jgi:hypothetical protein
MPSIRWRRAVIYPIDIRSFVDGNGDGVRDIAGIRSRLPYLAGLGVDGIWIPPGADRRWRTAETTLPTTAISTGSSAPLRTRGRGRPGRIVAHPGGAGE